MICNGTHCASVNYYRAHPIKTAPVSRPHHSGSDQASCGASVRFTGQCSSPHGGPNISGWLKKSGAWTLGLLSGLAPFTGAAAGAGLSAGEGAFDALDLLNVEQHLRGIEAWDDVPQNIAMVDRISQALADGRSLSEGEYNFMVHELTEADLMSRGVEQDIAHDLAGQTHPTFANYDPEVIKQFSEYFNHNWLKYWEKK